MTQPPFKPSLWISAMAFGTICGGIAVQRVSGEWSPEAFLGGGIVAFLCVATGALLRIQKFQFSLRALFWLVTVMAVVLGGWVWRLHRNEIAAKDAAIKAYRDAQAYIETLRPSHSPEAIDEMHKMVELSWTARYPEPPPDK
jgi:hypothetical protein